MQHSHRWMVLVLIIAALQLSACTQTSDKSSKIEPAHVEPLGEAGLNRVVLTEKAAKRLDIRTSPVREEEVVRKQRVGAEVVAALPEAEVTDLSAVWVRVNLIESELNKVDRGQPVLVLLLDHDDEDDDEEEAGVTAHEVEASDFDDLEDVDEPGDVDGALYYAVDSGEHGLVLGQRVLVEVSLLGGGMKKVIPYASVIYDLHGETWTYTSPEHLVYIRHPIMVDYIDSDLAVLLEGPPVGTEVVTAGVAELWGTESGVGGH